MWLACCIIASGSFFAEWVFSLFGSMQLLAWRCWQMSQQGLLPTVRGFWATSVFKSTTFNVGPLLCGGTYRGPPLRMSLLMEAVANIQCKAKTKLRDNPRRRP